MLRARSFGALLLVLLIFGVSGCWRTRYVQFAPRERAEPAGRYLTDRKSGWQHFFIWGWVPGERQIDAQSMCEGTDRIASIETRQTFAEGLVAALAGYYINIYSPYDGAVFCEDAHEESASSH